MNFDTLPEANRQAIRDAIHAWVATLPPELQVEVETAEMQGDLWPDVNGNPVLVMSFHQPDRIVAAAHLDGRPLGVHYVDGNPLILPPEVNR